MKEMSIAEAICYAARILGRAIILSGWGSGSIVGSYTVTDKVLETGTR